MYNVVYVIVLWEEPHQTQMTTGARRLGSLPSQAYNLITIGGALYSNLLGSPIKCSLLSLHFDAKY